jgi:hypothetical protein
MTKTKTILCRVIAGALILSVMSVTSVWALPGGTWQTGIKVQNLSSTDIASITVYLFNTDGDQVYALSQTSGGDPLQASPNSTVEVYLPNYSSVADGQYSAMVSSTQQIGAVATHTDYSYGLADSYNGMEGATTIYVPYVYHNHNNWSTEIFVQNTSSDTTAHVSATMTNGSTTKTYQMTLEPYGSGSFDTSQSQYDDLGWFIGAATITSTENVPLAVVVNEVRVAGTGDANGNVLVSFRGLTANDAGNRVVLPSLYKEFSGSNGTWRSGIKIQDISGSGATVNVTFHADSDSPTGSWTGSRTGLPISANGSEELYLANPVLDGGASIPDMFKGYAVIESTGGQVVATVIHTNYDAAGGKGVAAGYFGIASGSNELSIPSLYRWPSGAGTWVSGLKIQNVGTSAASVTVSFSTDPDSPNSSWTGTRSGISLDQNEAIELYLSNPILDGDGSLPDPPWKGSASVTCGSGCEIAATVIHTNYGRHVANMYMAIAK